MNTDDDAMARKRALFAQLDALNECDDSPPDESYQASVLALSNYAIRYNSGDTTRSRRSDAQPRSNLLTATLNRSTSLVEKRSSIKNTRLDLLKRSETTPNRMKDDAVFSEVVMVKDTPLPPRAPVNFPHAATKETRHQPNVISRSIAASKITGKRKHASGPPPVPEDLQIFRGLTMSL